MSVTLISLRAAHPEHDDTPDGVLQHAIDQADEYCNESTWGDLYDYGVMLLACHFASTTPYGGGGNLTEMTQSVYLQDWLRLAKDVGRSWRYV